MPSVRSLNSNLSEPSSTLAAKNDQQAERDAYAMMDAERLVIVFS